VEARTGARSLRSRSRSRAEASVELRLGVAGCLLGVALTHLLDLRDKLEEAPYLAAMFIALIAGSSALAIWFAVGRRLRLAWALAFMCSAPVIVGYVVSRSIGLPRIEDHVGHWADPFGTASLVFEITLVGLVFPALRREVMRLAAPATFLAAGLVAGGLMLGEASNSHVGHSHHEHAGHAGHAGHARHFGMNVYTATPRQRAQAQRLVDATSAAATSRFASFGAARAAGYGFTVKSFQAQRTLDYWHITNPAYLDDGRNLDPNRPESLMYWHRRGGPPKLIAVVYRVPTSEPNPSLGGPVLQWHLHRNARGGLGRYKMSHVWLVPGMLNAFSMEMPTAELTRLYGTPANGTGTGL